MAKRFGAVTENIAAGLILRHDSGSDHLADDFQDEIEFPGIENSPAFALLPEGSGVAVETLAPESATEFGPAA